jgi:hypothetical protein
MIDPVRQIAVTEAVSRGSEALAKSSLHLLAVARSSPQKRMAGNAVADAVSVERLTSRHCAPSAARVFSASAAKRTASLPIERCAGRRSLDARQSTT